MGSGCFRHMEMCVLCGLSCYEVFDEAGAVRLIPAKYG
jgi:hypothetical protein